VGWGFDLNSASLPEPIKVYRGANFYNAFRFYFTPSIDTSPNTELKVTLKLSEDASTAILQGSLSENLPPFN